LFVSAVGVMGNNKNNINEKGVAYGNCLSSVWFGARVLPRRTSSEKTLREEGEKMKREYTEDDLWGAYNIGKQDGKLKDMEEYVEALKEQSDTRNA
jgi:hypothetical protein